MSANGFFDPADETEGSDWTGFWLVPSLDWTDFLIGPALAFLMGWSFWLAGFLHRIKLLIGLRSSWEQDSDWLAFLMGSSFWLALRSSWDQASDWLAFLMGSSFWLACVPHGIKLLIGLRSSWDQASDWLAFLMGSSFWLAGVLYIPVVSWWSLDKPFVPTFQLHVTMLSTLCLGYL